VILEIIRDKTVRGKQHLPERNGFSDETDIKIRRFDVKKKSEATRPQGGASPIFKRDIKAM